MKYKVKNKLNCRLKLGTIIFEAGETKELDERPTSDKFIIEEIKEKSNSDKVIVEEIKHEKKPTKLKENKE